MRNGCKVFVYVFSSAALFVVKNCSQALALLTNCITVSFLKLDGTQEPFTVPPSDQSDPLIIIPASFNEIMYQRF